MDSSNNKQGTGSGRRSSIRRSIRSSNGSTSRASHDDEYDLSAIMVSDGFRPSANNPSLSQPSDYHTNALPDSALHSQSLVIDPSLPQSTNATLDDQLEPPAALSDMRNRPSSVSKPPRQHDSLALRNDGSGNVLAGMSNSHVARASSLSSEAPVIRVESPYRGPSGPSHPYQMYPQRTMSVATTSTAAAPTQERSYTGPRGPTHPYALYTQNTVPTAESTDPSIPVGFNGLGSSYERQLGPDGEEAGDLIGPLGHTEELPPYSRYPDNSFGPKNEPQAVTETPTSPTRSIVGAGGIGRATRNPEFSSTEDLGVPRTRPSVRSNNSENSHHDINTGARDVAEKRTMTKWQRRAKKKLWGIVPYWAICLLTVGLVIVGIIMGAVIGTLLSKHKPPPPPTQTTPSSESEIETETPTGTIIAVKPFATLPPDLDPIQPGAYDIYSFEVYYKKDDCLKNKADVKAWSCDATAPASFFQLEIVKDPHEKNKTKNYYANLIANTDKNYWGPQFETVEHQQLIIVNDTADTNYGPAAAWWFSINYNKTVIVSSEELSLTTSSKRGLYDYDDDDDDAWRRPPPDRFGKQKGPGVGDKTWLCTWPNTTLEFFIYPNQNTSISSGASSTSKSNPTATSASSYLPSSSRTPYNKVVKMVERRFTGASTTSASCVQITIKGSDRGDYKVECDEHGKPIKKTIPEQPKQWTQKQALEIRGRSPKISRWFMPDLISRSNSDTQLTDCGCMWVAT